MELRLLCGQLPASRGKAFTRLMTARKALDSSQRMVHELENYGGTQVKFEKDGKLKAMDFQVTDCKKPLASVAKIIDRGNRVVFDKDESYILNKATGENIMLERERGTFVMVVEFEMDEDENTTSCFRRHA